MGIVERVEEGIVENEGPTTSEELGLSLSAELARGGRREEVEEGGRELREGVRGVAEEVTLGEGVLEEEEEEDEATAAER